LPTISGIFPFLVVAWGVSAVVLSLPGNEEMLFSDKLLLVVPPLVLSILFSLARPKDGMSLWAMGLTFLVTQTGFQADIGGIRSSALEISLIGLLMVTLMVRPWTRGLRRPGRWPGSRAFVYFAAYSAAILLVGVVRGDDLARAMGPFKGFVLYPAMIYLLLLGVRSERTLRWITGFAVLWYGLVASRGIWQFLTHQEGAMAGGVYRASGDYAPVNLYSASLAAMALMVGGLVTSGASLRRRWQRRILTAVFCWLVVGSITAVSRSPIVGLLMGGAVLANLSGKRTAMVALALTGVVLLFFGILPDPVEQGVYGRLTQLSDSSTFKREFYLQSGLHALARYWPAGAGWGHGFWYRESTGLIESGSVPWFHNDYLNLAVQVGIPGLVLYLGFWIGSIRAGVVWLRNHPTAPTSGYVTGGLAALVCLLAVAMFEHVLWRPDMAGLVAWLAGVTVAAMNIGQRTAEGREWA